MNGLRKLLQQNYFNAMLSAWVYKLPVAVCSFLPGVNWTIGEPNTQLKDGVVQCSVSTEDQLNSVLLSLEDEVIVPIDALAGLYIGLGLSGSEKSRSLRKVVDYTIGCDEHDRYLFNIDTAVFAAFAQAVLSPKPPRYILIDSLKAYRAEGGNLTSAGIPINLAFRCSVLNALAKVYGVRLFGIMNPITQRPDALDEMRELIFGSTRGYLDFTTSKIRLRLNDQGCNDLLSTKAFVMPPPVELPPTEVDYLKTKIKEMEAKLELATAKKLDFDSTAEMRKRLQAVIDDLKEKQEQQKLALDKMKLTTETERAAKEEARKLEAAAKASLSEAIKLKVELEKILAERRIVFGSSAYERTVETEDVMLRFGVKKKDR